MVDAERLKRSFALVAQHGDQVPLYFYSTLFLTYPETRDMFPVSMAAQRDKLVTALGHAVSHVDDLDKLVPFLQQLGRDHRKFAVVPEHYPAVGATLLATLEHFLGPDWTPELAADWQDAYNLVAKIMADAAQQASVSSPPWWEAEVTSHERRTPTIAVIRLRTDKQLNYQPGQSLALETQLRPQLWRYYSPANAPRVDREIELHVRLVPGGPVSGALVHVLQPGDIVRLGAPVGRGLTLDQEPPGELVFVAGGTGLSPLQALIDQLAREQIAAPGGASPPDVHLFVGARTEPDLYNMPYLEALAKEHGWLSVVPAVSDDPGYAGERGTVVDVALRHGPWDGAQVYVCGSPGMMAGSVQRLTEAGVPTERIRFEDFGGYSNLSLSLEGGPG